MTINTAIAAYEAATNGKERREAFEAIVEWIAADPELPEDADFIAGAEKALTDRGIHLAHRG